MDTYRLGKLYDELSRLEQWKHLFESGSIAGQFLKFLEMIGEHPKLASEFRKGVLMLLLPESFSFVVVASTNLNLFRLE